MKAEEIRALNSEELVRQLEIAHKGVFELRFRLATKQLVNHRQLRVTKKTIARMKTIMKERELSPG